MSAACILTTTMIGFIDARERPKRPIPAGDMSAQAVAAIGFGLLIVATVMMTLFGLVPSALSLVLVAVIVWYDVVHSAMRLALWLWGYAAGWFMALPLRL